MSEETHAPSLEERTLEWCARQVEYAAKYLHVYKTPEGMLAALADEFRKEAERSKEVPAPVDRERERDIVHCIAWEAGRALAAKYPMPTVPLDADEWRAVVDRGIEHLRALTGEVAAPRDTPKCGPRCGSDARGYGEPHVADCPKAPRDTLERETTLNEGVRNGN